MNTDEGELDPVKRAQVSKLRVEALVAFLTVLLYAKVLLGEDAKARIKHQLKRLRVILFGPPPMTEDQIKEAERQVVIEAMRTVRYES